jgi:hypothetical protein
MELGISHVTSRIYLGGMFESPNDVYLLRAHDVTDVINCREDDDPDYIKSQFGYCWPKPRQKDNGKPRGQEWFAEGVGYALDALAAPGMPKKVIYVHCRAGFNRSASMVYAILRSIGLGNFAAREMICRHRWEDLLGIRYADEAIETLRALGYLPGRPELEV